MSAPRPPVNAGPPAAVAVVPSPCNSVCRIDPGSGWCLGCARTIEEITAWASLDGDAKRAVWSLLPQRRQHLGLPPLR